MRFTRSLAVGGAETRRSRWGVRVAAVTLCCGYLGLVCGSATAWADGPLTFTGTTELVSRGWAYTYSVAMSGEGRYVAFDSGADNLVVGDTNGQADVFVLDRQTSQIERVSVASDGTQGNARNWGPAVSADGRYVAFTSEASNLVAGDTNGAADAFVHDRQTGQTERVSVASSGAQGNAGSYAGAVSADGRYVAFGSEATNLMGGDTNASEDAFVHDRQTGQTERVSVSSSGAQGNGFSYHPAISVEGRYVAFASGATDLVPGDTNGEFDVFLRDRVSGLTQRVSVASDGTQGADSSNAPTISADGRYVVFSSYANLVAGPYYGQQIFVHDCQTGQTQLVSVDSAGTRGDWCSYLSVGVSADGRCAAFETKSDNLIASDTNGTCDIFVHDRQTGLTERVSVANDGSEAVGQSLTPVALSADGRHIAFLSEAVNLVPGGPPPLYRQCAYVRDRVSETGFYAYLNARGKVPLLVRFTDLSAYTPSGPAVAWDWDFGDGGGSAEQNPTHEYAKVGVYTVSLTATCAEGPLTTVKEGYITVSFDDVAICPPDAADYWALRHILACVEAEVVGGYSDGTYRPTLPVTRDQMAVFISRALAGGDSRVPTGPPTATFSDVPTGYWAFKYVEYAVDNGVVGGYSDGTYRPTVTVTRDQMAVFVARAIVGGDSLVPTGPATATFPDVPTDYWAFKYVEYIKTEGVTGGYPDGTYRPTEAVTRDQMAVYVARAFDLPL